MMDQMPLPKDLQKALDAIDQLPDDWFGNETASFEDLPGLLDIPLPRHYFDGDVLVSDPSEDDGA
jgi:hypothetical protein